VKSHDEDPVQILRFVQGDLNARELDEFSRHLEACGECRARVEEEMALSGLLQEAAPLYTAPTELRARVAALLAKEPGSRSGLRANLQEIAERIGYEIRRSWSWGARRWLPALCAASIALLCTGICRSLLQEFRAREYVEAAIAAHRDALDGRVPLQIQSDVPETVSQWVNQQVPIHFQLPASQAVPRGSSRFRLAGARVVQLKRGNGVMISYRRQEQSVSLLVAADSTAVVAGGDEVRDGRLLFHYRNETGFNVITWNNHGLAYALVSSVSGPARQSCLVCHGSLPVVQLH
jgi:anti-sigma factor RsiW